VAVSNDDDFEGRLPRTLLPLLRSSRGAATPSRFHADRSVSSHNRVSSNSVSFQLATTCTGLWTTGPGIALGLPESISRPPSFRPSHKPRTPRDVLPSVRMCSRGVVAVAPLFVARQDREAVWLDARCRMARLYFGDIRDDGVRWFAHRSRRGARRSLSPRSACGRFSSLCWR